MYELIRSCSRYFVVFVVMCVLAHCSSYQRGRFAGNSPAQQELVEQNPIQVEILDEIYDGETLSLVLEVRSELSISSDLVKVKLDFFKSGTRESSAEFALEQLRKLETFEPVGLVDLAAHSYNRLLLQQEVGKGVTDYQITVSWEGADSETPETEQSAGEVLLASSAKELPLRCGDQCWVPFQLVLSLQNPFRESIQNLRLLSWFEQQGASTPPDDSQKGVIDLKNKVLAPQERVQVLVKLKTPLPFDLYEKGYRPQVELDTFEFVPAER
ncbi:MAG: hypothetical protein KDD70_00775 [Bdellovibrionales bacterium]|nr:hypothetical protein [Bdellovibrionales bacterium]